MSNSVLDLRNSNNKTETISYHTTKKNSGGETTKLVEERSIYLKGEGLFEWTAYEYIYHEHGSSWFLTTGGVAVLFIILGIFTKSYFFITFVALAFLVIVLYAKRKPQKINFAILKEGVRVGGRVYDFSGLKSFWIFEKDSEKELSLATDKTLAHFIRLPLGEADSNKVRGILSNFLSEEEHQEFISDQVAKILGL